MNNFPAMTVAQQQELIADLRVLLIDKDDEDKTPETLIARIALAALTADGWIKCSERMPEKGQSVLASGTWFEYAVIAWDGKNWLDLDYEGPVTHWMPLPQPPEASNEQ